MAGETGLVAVMNGLLDDGRFDRRAGRQRLGTDEDSTVLDHHAIRRNALVERRRRLAILRPILPAVPGASDAAVNDLALAKRSALMGADVRHGGDSTVVTKDGDPFLLGRADNLGTVVGDFVDVASVDPASDSLSPLGRELG
jgi:hypothetical protein